MDETSKGGMGIASLVIVVVLLFMKFALVGDVEDNRIEIGFNPNDLIVIEKREGYERCALTKYPQKCDSLTTLWNTFRHKDTDVMERMFSFSFTHRDKYKTLLNHAFYSEEDVLFGLPLSDQNEILKLRAIVSSMYSKEELESSDHSELISDIFIIVHESDRNFSDLKAVKFNNSTWMNGIYLNKGEEKGVLFHKISGEWKIDMYREGVLFEKEKSKHEEEVLAEYGSFKAYYRKALGLRQELFLPLKKVENK